MPASIIFDQVDASAGSAGEARDDFVTAKQVTCSNASVESSYLWTLVDVPIRSALVRGTTSTSSTFQFTPDVKGTYLVTLRINSSALEADNASSFCAILTTRGWRYKAAQERGEDNITRAGLGFSSDINPRGWGTQDDLEREEVEAALDTVDANAADLAAAVTTTPGASSGTASLVRIDEPTGLIDLSLMNSVGTTPGASSGSAPLVRIDEPSGLIDSSLLPVGVDSDTINEYVLDTGALPNGNIYVDFASMYADASLVGGLKRVYLITNVTVSSGTYDLSTFEFLGTYGTNPGSKRQVTFDGTALISAMPRLLEDLRWLNNRAGAPALCTPTESFITYVRRSQIVSAPVGMISLSAGSAPVYADFYLFNSSMSSNTFDAAGATSWTVSISLHEGSVLLTDYVTGTVGDISVYAYGTSQTLGTSSFSGTHTIIRREEALTRGYNTGAGAFGAELGDWVLAGSALGTSTVTLPAVTDNSSQPGGVVVVTDQDGNAGTNNITVDTADATTINGAPSYVLNKDFQVVRFVLNNDATEWVVVSETLTATNKVNTRMEMVDEIASYQLDEDDFPLTQHRFVTLAGLGAITITVPEDASADIDVGASITFDHQGASTVTFAPENGTITIDSLDSNLDIISGGTACLVKKAANLWKLTGELE